MVQLVVVVSKLNEKDHDQPRTFPCTATRSFGVKDLCPRAHTYTHTHTLTHGLIIIETHTHTHTHLHSDRHIESRELPPTDPHTHTKRNNSTIRPCNHNKHTTIQNARSQCPRDELWRKPPQLDAATTTAIVIVAIDGQQQQQPHAQVLHVSQTARYAHPTRLQGPLCPTGRRARDVEPDRSQPGRVQGRLLPSRRISENAKDGHVVCPKDCLQQQCQGGGSTGTSSLDQAEVSPATTISGGPSNDAAAARTAAETAEATFAAAIPTPC